MEASCSLLFAGAVANFYKMMQPLGVHTLQLVVRLASLVSQHRGTPRTM